MKTTRLHLFLATALTLGAAALPLHAQWLQNGDAGPYEYTNPVNGHRAQRPETRGY